MCQEVGITHINLGGDAYAGMKLSNIIAVIVESEPSSHHRKGGFLFPETNTNQKRKGGNNYVYGS